MDDALFVCGFERLGNLLRDQERVIERQTATRLNHFREIRTVDQLHDER